jgi:hypothetical protein
MADLYSLSPQRPWAVGMAFQRGIVMRMQSLPQLAQSTELSQVNNTGPKYRTNIDEQGRGTQGLSVLTESLALIARSVSV